MNFIWVVDDGQFNESSPRCERYVWVKDTPSGVVVLNHGRETRVLAKAAGRHICRSEDEAKGLCSDILLKRAHRLEDRAEEFRKQASKGVRIEEVSPEPYEAKPIKLK